VSTEPIKLLVALLLAEMELKPEQVTIYNQKFDIPTDERLYINLGILGTKTFSARNHWEPDPVDGNLTEIQDINRQELISVLAYSRGPAARERNWEIPLVFSSIRAQQVMEANSFVIGRIPVAMNDVSEQDGTSRLNRYSFTISLLSAHQKIKAVDYYDSFPGPLLITNP
jgi:hypothetical protein